MVNVVGRFQRRETALGRSSKAWAALCMGKPPGGDYELFGENVDALFNLV
jgi:hypothetical protein